MICCEFEVVQFSSAVVWIERTQSHFSQNSQFCYLNREVSILNSDTIYGTFTWFNNMMVSLHYGLWESSDFCMSCNGALKIGHRWLDEACLHHLDDCLMKMRSGFGFDFCMALSLHTGIHFVMSISLIPTSLSSKVTLVWLQKCIRSVGFLF